MSEKGIICLRPPYPVTEDPDPPMDALLKCYAQNPELPSVQTGSESSQEAAEDSRPYTKGYPWPASRLTSEEMSILYLWRMKTGTPINELLRQCVQEMHKLIGRGEP